MLDIGILVIIHLDDIELPCSQKVCKTLRNMRTTGAIQYIDLNALAFAYQQVRPVDLATHWVSYHGTRYELSEEQYDKGRNNTDECP